MSTGLMFRVHPLLGVMSHKTVDYGMKVRVAALFLCRTLEEARNMFYPKVAQPLKMPTKSLHKSFAHYQESMISIIANLGQKAITPPICGSVWTHQQQHIATAALSDRAQFTTMLLLVRRYQCSRDTSG